MPSTTCRRSRAPRHRRSAILAAVTALSLGLAACGDDDGAGAAAPGTPATIEVRAVDFAFEDLPERVPVGTTLTLVNDAPTEMHELVAFRLPDDEDRSVAELMALPPEELMGALGGHPETVLLAPPGADQIAAVGDGTLGQAGRYAIICVIPTGVAPDVYLAAAAETEEGPPQIDGAGPPHIVHGMFAELIVE